MEAEVRQRHIKIAVDLLKIFFMLMGRPACPCALSAPRGEGALSAPATPALADRCAGPVSAEVTATDAEGMLAEGRALRAIAANVAVKVPLTEAGLVACRTLAGEGAMVNVTLCFSAAQALLAAKAGATFISPFVGRLDDISTDGMRLIADIVSGKPTDIRHDDLGVQRYR